LQEKRKEMKKLELKKKVAGNTTASITKSGVKTTTKQGASLDPMSKVVPSRTMQVGLAKGATINMGDYQSLRVDAWGSSDVQEGETPQQVFEYIESLVDEQIEISIEDAKKWL
jgi:hypothetical protein